MRSIARALVFSLLSALIPPLSTNQITDSLILPAIAVETLAEDSAETSPAHFFAEDWKNSRAAGQDWTRKGMLPDLTNKQLEGLDRTSVIKILGEPARSDEVVPKTQHRSLLDFYELSAKNDSHFCVKYDRGNKVENTYIENTPLVIPDFMKMKTSKSLMDDKKLSRFLFKNSELTRHGMNKGEIKKQLGEPEKITVEESFAGGNRRKWLRYIYYLKSDKQKIFIVTFDMLTKKIYEYRTIEVNYSCF